MENGVKRIDLDDGVEMFMREPDPGLRVETITGIGCKVEGECVDIHLYNDNDISFGLDECTDTDAIIEVCIAIYKQMKNVQLRSY